MKTACVIFAILIMSVILGAALSYRHVGAAEGEQTMTQPKQYFVRLLGTRDTWPDDMTPDEDKIMGEHYAYLKDLVKKKKVYMAGPVFDARFGLIVLSVGSEQEAREIMDNEPSVLAGLHTYDMSEMRVSLLVDHISRDRYTPEPTDRVLKKEVTVPVPVDRAWQAWTTTEGVKSFFSSEAEVELRVGGRFEIYFLTDAPYGSKGSEDCKILSYLPNRMLSFEWNAPPSFGDLRGIHTHVVLFFDVVNPRQTKVTLSHLGWGSGEEWDKLYDYFDNAWGRVLTNFAEAMAGSE